VVTVYRVVLGKREDEFVASLEVERSDMVSGNRGQGEGRKPVSTKPAPDVFALSDKRHKIRPNEWFCIPAIKPLPQNEGTIKVCDFGHSSQ